MRNLIVFVLVTFAFRANAQHQVKIDPANLGDDIVTEELVKRGPNYVHAGKKSGQAVVTCHDPFGGLLWSKVCGSFSSALSVTCASNGKVVVGGEIWNDALVAAFNSDGSAAWAKSFETVSTERWNYVAADAAGNAYVVGHNRTNSANSREIWMKLDPMGNPLWTKQALRSSDSYSSFGYGYVKGDSLIVVGVTLNNGVASFGNKDISLTIISTQTGSVLSHRYLGTIGYESFIDAQANQNGLFVLFGIANGMSGFGSDRAVMKINWNSLSSPTTAVILAPNFMSSYTLDWAGELTLDGQDVYVSGGLTGIGTQASYVIKLDQNLVVQWSRKVTTGGSLSYPVIGSASVGFGGGVSLVDLKMGISPLAQSILTTLNSSGATNGISCQEPTGFLTEGIGYWMGNGTQTLAFDDVTFSVSNVNFDDYLPQTTSCGGLLPVEMLSFDGEQIDRTIELRWSTGSEQGSSHFEILRSTDEGQTWAEIGSVPSAGNSVVVTNYVSVDEHPEPGMNYYRLRQVDQDGTSTDEPKVVPVKFVVEGELLLYPNPLPRGEPLQGLDGQEFEILGLAGQVVRGSGFDTDLSQLSSGMYVIRVTKTGATSRVTVSD